MTKKKFNRFTIVEAQYRISRDLASVLLSGVRKKTWIEGFQAANNVVKKVLSKMMKDSE